MSVRFHPLEMTLQQDSYLTSVFGLFAYVTRRKLGTHLSKA